MTAPAAATRMRFRSQSAQKGFDSKTRGRASQQSVASQRPCVLWIVLRPIRRTRNPSRRDMVHTVTAHRAEAMPIRTFAYSDA